MEAYSKTDLYNKHVRQQATEALQAACIKEESYHNILQAHLCNLYTPNYFIRIALGLLTIVATLFSALLLFLIFSLASGNSLAILLIFMAIACYITLELFVKTKKYYNAGIDNILMSLIAIFIAGSFFAYNYKVSWLAISSVIMPACLWLSIRFTDRFMAMISYFFFFIFLFLVYNKAGNIAKATSPFFMMAVSAIFYFVMRKGNEFSLTYSASFKAVIFLSLITFYASGNYFIVKELSNQLFHLQLPLQRTIPFGWLFWAFTFLIPFIYIFYGINKKDLLVMRTGLGLLAATVFTIKYYYTIFPVETETLIAGIILITISYGLIKYLRRPLYGFTSNARERGSTWAFNAEAILIASTFTTNTKTHDTGSSRFYDGGSGGGAGATGQF